MAMGIGLGLVLGMANGVIITIFRVPSLVATLGTSEHLPLARLLCIGGHEVNLADLPPGYSDPASQTLASRYSSSSRSSRSWSWPWPSA